MTPTDEYNNAYGERRIDQLLQAFATTPAPAGLEQRVAARLAQRAAETESPSSLLPSWFLEASRSPFAIAAAASVLLVATYGIAREAQQREVALQTATLATPDASSPSTVASFASPESVNASTPPRRVLTVATASAPAPTNDPDALALAETLAPSQRTEAMPLTEHEALLVQVTRSGQPIEVAELEPGRNALLAKIAAARARAKFLDDAQGLLAPLAVAESLTPTSSPVNDERPLADAAFPSSR